MSVAQDFRFKITFDDEKGPFFIKKKSTGQGYYFRS